MTSLRTPLGAELFTPTLPVLPPVAPLLTCPTCEHRPSAPLSGTPVCSTPDEDEFVPGEPVECRCDDPWHVANTRRTAPGHRFRLRPPRRLRHAA